MVSNIHTFGGTGRSGKPTSLLFGRFMLPDQSEYPCQVNEITTQAATFVTSVRVAAGMRIIAYLDQIGRIECIAGQPAQDGFQVTFKLSRTLCERIEAWLARPDGAARAIDEKQHRHVPYEPKDKRSYITLPDGRIYPCEVADISPSGAVVNTVVIPNLSTYVRLGKMDGRVVRYHEDGFAIEFTRASPRIHTWTTTR